MARRIQLRKDTAANWASVNPTLAQGEVAIITDTRRMTVGDGSTAFNSLGSSYIDDETIRTGTSFTLASYPVGARKRIYNSGASPITVTMASGETIYGLTAFLIPVGEYSEIEKVTSATYTANRIVLSFTPVLSFGGATTGITYSTQVGRLVKTGNKVEIAGRIGLSSKGTATGGAVISGFNIPSADLGSNVFPVNCVLANATYTGQHQAYIQQGVANFTIQYVTEAGATTQLLSTNFTNNTVIMFSGFYFI